ncbi:MAG TPA: hypothetical protein VMX13_06630 [Sedimentisphaerales bacterium]|nr:hypothetical protein [Sedimentisphaerales bacterium]
MKDVVEIIRAINDWPFTVCVIGVVFIVVMRDRIAEWAFRWKSPNREIETNVKAKDIRNLPVRRVGEGVSEGKPTADPEEVAKPPILKKSARKVLATLWNGQNRHYPEKGISEGQWSFRILPNVFEYGNFMVGFAQLLELGLAGWEVQNGQAVLTKEGWEYAKEHPEIRESEDRYRL